jgi:WD40 repeat protein
VKPVSLALLGLVFVGNPVRAAQPPNPGHWQVGMPYACFSADGARLLLAYCTTGDHRGCSLALYDVAGGKQIHMFILPGIPEWPRFVLLPDGRHVLLVHSDHLSAPGDGETLEVWDATTGERVRTLGTATKGKAWTCCLAVSADGRRALAGLSDGTLALWDLETGTRLRTFDIGQRGEVLSVTFSADGQRALSGGSPNAGTALTLWDVETGQAVRSYPNSDDPLKSPLHWGCCFALSPSGRYVAAEAYTRPLDPGDTAEQCMVLWAADGKSARRLKVCPRAAAFTPDGKQLLCAQADARRGWLQAWDVEDGKVMAPQPVRKALLPGLCDSGLAVFSPDARLLVTASGFQDCGWGQGGDSLVVKLWDVTTGRALHVLREPPRDEGQARRPFWRLWGN